jgi:NAD(P)-dependent dehydrogenase (short-subunit alcohol dehydrogenase family)
MLLMSEPTPAPAPAPSAQPARTLTPAVPKTVLITGASRGIGAACARTLAAQGWAVALNHARSPAAAGALAAELRRSGTQAATFGADVADPQAVRELFDWVDREFPPLAALVNNAGIVAPGSRVEDIGAERLQRVFAVNVFGSFHCAREAIRRLSTRHGGAGGAIVNIGSAASRLGSPGEYVDYAASKGAIDSFTLGLARELAGEGIRVNAVRPGIIDTEIHASGGRPDRAQALAPSVPMQRPGTAAEVAAAVAWLLSDAASYTTGALLDVSGGR